MAYCNFEITDYYGNGKPYMVFIGSSDIVNMRITLYYYDGDRNINWSKYDLYVNPYLVYLAGFTNGSYKLVQYSCWLVKPSGGVYALSYTPNYDFTLDYTPPVGPDKASNPTPADLAVEINKDTTTLSWDV